MTMSSFSNCSGISHLMPCDYLMFCVIRLHLGLLNGAVLAILFPVLDTYTLPLEVEMYWVQHTLMIAIPAILIMTESHGRMTPVLLDTGSILLSYSIFFLYHLLLLQPLALLSRVNLDFVLCPAPSDPFHGQLYIAHACWTQLIVIAAVNKLYSLFESTVINLTRLNKKV